MPEIRLDPILLHIGRSKVQGSSTQSYLSHEYWALHLYFNRGYLTVERSSYDIVPGSVSLTPLGSVSRYFTEDPLDHVFVHFVVGETGPIRNLPIFTSGGSDTETTAGALITALSVYRDDPDWARVKVTDALFSLASVDSRDADHRSEHPALSAILTYIDFNLPEVNRLDDIADHVNLSKTHVNRLFQEHLGVSAMKYIRQKRMEMARYLLVSTILPVKEIAYQVGVPDIHAFNKLCKKFHGMPPSGIRKSML